MTAYTIETSIINIFKMSKNKKTLKDTLSITYSIDFLKKIQPSSKYFLWVKRCNNISDVIYNNPRCSHTNILLFILYKKNKLTD